MFVFVFVIHNYTEEVIDDKPLLETQEEVRKVFLKINT